VRRVVDGALVHTRRLAHPFRLLRLGAAKRGQFVRLARLLVHRIVQQRQRLGRLAVPVPDDRRLGLGVVVVEQVLAFRQLEVGARLALTLLACVADLERARVAS
jgi:hypothetical protein